MSNLINELVQSVNEQIKLRTKYGYRTENHTKMGYVLHWSNSGWRWMIYSLKKRGEIKLDSNQIFVEDTRENINSYIKDLMELPLAKGAFELR